MPAPTVYLVNSDTYFLEQMQRRLLPNGIHVEEQELEDLPKLFEPRFQEDCVILNVDMSNVHQLIYHKIFDLLHQKPHPEMYALVYDESLIKVINNHAGDEIKTYGANILLERLVLNLLTNLTNLRYQEGDVDYQLVMHGHLSELALPKLIEYLQKSGFTGRVSIEVSADQEGMLRFSNGKLRKIVHQDFAEQQALHFLALNGMQYRVEQELVNNRALTAHLANSRNSAAISLNDLLTDVFYFMHEEFERIIRPEAIQRVVEDTFLMFGNWEKDGLYFLYNPEWQEKLQIVGEIQSYQVSNILEMYETIFSDLSGKTNLNSFDEFINSLNEIKPYMMQMRQLQPLLADTEINML